MREGQQGAEEVAGAEAEAAKVAGGGSKGQRKSMAAAQSMKKRPSLTVGRRGEEPRQISRKWSRGNKMGGAISRRNWSRVEGRN